MDKADGDTVVNGFDGNIVDSTANPTAALRWYCAPDSWTPNEGTYEGTGGSWAVQDDGSLRLQPAAKKDFWRKTYYEPLLIKDDASVLYAELDSTDTYTMETSFELTATRQFDQAGLVVRLDSDHWLKTGIEVVDGEPKVSCVVTNVYSDWSTQEWTTFTSECNDDEVKVQCSIRVHCRGNNFVVEAKMADGHWKFIRIAHLSRCMECSNDPISVKTSCWKGPAAPRGKLWAGIFAACPEDQKGTYAVFSWFVIRRGSNFDHNADVLL